MKRYLGILALFALLTACNQPSIAPLSPDSDVRTLAVTGVFINEIHYDNVSTDSGEAIEIAGPAGTDLAGWSLVLYNGSNGTTYDTTSLVGVLPDGGGGFGTAVVTYPTNGIQNGSPDGVALIDAGNSVVQFLSYEGTFTAVGGPADGLASTDIGMAETSSTPVGDSLQLTGTGTAYEDFSWSAPQASTFGSANSGQSFGGTATVTLVINEIDYDQPGTDAAEFIEIANTGSVAADLSGYTLELVNGSGATVYTTIALPAVSLAPGDYFVVCANAATVANCDLDATPDTNFIQNGAPDAVALWQGSALVDAVSYEGDTAAPYTEGSGAGLEDSGSAGNDDLGISRFPDGVDSNVNNVDFSPRCITPGEANSSDTGGCGVVAPPTAPTLIHAIQGSGDDSPLDGSTVVIEGVVVGDFQNNGGPDSGDLSGFFVQEEDAEADADPATSEGIFVYDGSGTVDVESGDLVRITGTVDEFNGLTEITNVASVTVVSSDNPLPSAANVTLPLTSLDDLEAVEGMRVVLPQELVIGEYFNFDRFGEIALTAPMPGEERLFQPTDLHEPGSSAAEARAAYNALARITVDDGRTSQNPDPALHPDGDPFTLANRFRGGDLVEGIEGVMTYAFGLYRLQPTVGGDYTAANLRPSAPAVGGDLVVASLNVLNFFTTLDGSGPICGPTGGQDCRGADDAGEYDRQLDKIVAALVGLDADIVGLVELENNADASLQALVDAVNAELGSDSYSYIDTGTIGSDAIKVGLLYRPAVVAPLGDFALLDSSVDPRFLDSKNRPTLAQTFIELDGGRLTVAVNHLKSKGSSCDDVGDPTDPDGQGNCNGTRTEAAEALADWLAGDPTGRGDGDTLIIGDLNAYSREDPVQALEDAGYQNLIGPVSYSYLFDAQVGSLDHALASASLAAQVTGAGVWHINADEPDLLDYDTSFKKPAQDALYEPNAFRSSDHDPLRIGLSLTADPSLLGALLLDDVQALAADGTLNRGNANALQKKLEGALSALASGNGNAAAGKFGAFANQVEAMGRSGRLPADVAADLAGRARRAAAAL